MQSVLRILYPDQCVACGALVDGAHGLCASCWRETPFIRGIVCDLCGAPLIGEGSGHTDLCDDCLATPRPWVKGRAALLYAGSARRIVLGLKHGDRTDLVRPAARWMVEAGSSVLSPEVLLLPVPAHWLRLLQRRYNQAAELAREIGRLASLEVRPDGLVRVRRTRVQDGMTVEERQANTDGAIRARRSLAGRKVVIVDDVMTSGSTLAAATGACIDAGAAQVSVLVLARVGKTP